VPPPCIPIGPCVIPTRKSSKPNSQPQSVPRPKHIFLYTTLTNYLFPESYFKHSPQINNGTSRRSSRPHRRSRHTSATLPTQAARPRNQGLRTRQQRSTPVSNIHHHLAPIHPTNQTPPRISSASPQPTSPSRVSPSAATKTSTQESTTAGAASIPQPPPPPPPPPTTPSSTSTTPPPPRPPRKQSTPPSSPLATTRTTRTKSAASKSTSCTTLSATFTAQRSASSSWASYGPSTTT
jgi:hypothetical protein